jgi:hypothetical protein
MLVGLAPGVIKQLERTGIVQDIGRENLFGATEEIGQALMQAMGRRSPGLRRNGKQV